MKTWEVTDMKAHEQHKLHNFHWITHLNVWQVDNKNTLYQKWEMHLEK